MYLIMSDYSMGETPDNAFEYLRPLLTFASDNIPKEKHKVTTNSTRPRAPWHVGPVTVGL